MLTATVAQLSAAASITTADYVEIEQGGASKKGTVAQVVAGIVATSAQTLLGSVNTAVITPATLRAGINAENAAPIYACRAWANFDGTTTSSSITATFTRLAGSTVVTCIATSHGCITGNVQYASAASGTISTNSYVVTYVDDNTFTISTTSTSTSVGSLTLFRSPRNGYGNIGSVSYNGATAGTYFINFSVEMPSAYYSIATGVQATDSGNIMWIVDAVTPTSKYFKVGISNDAGAELVKTGYVQVFA